MPIKIGNVEIATVFKGNVELDNIAVGKLQQWVGIIVTPDPSIAYVSRTITSLTFDLTNNHTEPVTIYYGTGNPYPNGSTVSVAANATERVTLSGLADGTSFTISAVALEAEQLPSVGSVSFTQSTATATTAAPSIFNVNPDITSVSFTLRNNDDETAVVYYEVNDSTPDIQVTLAPNATTNRTISGLSGGTSYTLFARAKQSNENFSSTVSTGFTTDPEPFELGTITYSNENFIVNSQEDDPNGMQFNNNGTKMYICGRNLRVYQYSLSSAFNVNTASYDGVNFYYGSFSNGQGMAFNNNGTKMYIVGSTSDKVVQYSLSSAFDITTASYDNVDFFVGSQEFGPLGMQFNNNGTKMYIVGIGQNKVFQYSLSSAFNVGTASYDNVSFSVPSRPTALEFNSNGSKMFVLSNGQRGIYQYSLSSAFNVGTASYDNVSFVQSSSNAWGFKETDPQGFAFNNDGTKIYITGQSARRVWAFNNAF